MKEKVQKKGIVTEIKQLKELYLEMLDQYHFSKRICLNHCSPTTPEEIQSFTMIADKVTCIKGSKILLNLSF